MEVLEYSNLGKRDRDYEVQEAARTGIDNARKLLHILSHQQRSQLGDEESDAAAGVAVSKFQKVVSLLSRTGHARFRRAPTNPTISGYEYVFFESANFAQEEELKRIHLAKDHQSREKETMNFVPDPPAAPVAPSSSAAAVASVAAVVPQYPRPSSVSSADGSSGHANSSVPAFLQHAQQLQQQQHLQLRQHQLQVQQQVQQQIQQQLLWQQQHVAPVGFVPVLPTPTEIISFGKQHQHQQESSRSALMQEKASRSSQVDNSMSSGPPLSTTTKSGFSVVSMDGSGATDNNLQKQQQQTSSALSPAALEPRAQAGGGHHHAAAGNNNKKSSGITSDDNGGAKSSCASVGRCHRSKRRKLRMKRTIKVPAISSKLADIPPDDYSWRKYGQKPIKGSPHPRGYYKCSSMRNCPARKHVERSVEDSSMLIVTYEGEHSHSHTPSTTSTVLTVQS
ncbi:hypothetical protein BDL97_04G059400 [Sphagnum fallax]|nr:hypothetical protein BDL97_04G059400 [Sphagnum fallax]